MRLDLEAHQARAADLVQQSGLVSNAVHPLVQIILEGLGDEGTGSCILSSLLCALCSGSQLLVLGLCVGSLLGLSGSLGQLLDGVLCILVLGGLVILLQGCIVVIVVAVALRGPCAVGSLDDCVDALAEDLVGGRILTDELGR